MVHLGHLSLISVSHKALSRFILFNGSFFFPLVILSQEILTVLLLFSCWN